MEREKGKKKIAKSKRSHLGCLKDGWRRGAGGDSRFYGIVLREEPLVLGTGQEVEGGVGATLLCFRGREGGRRGGGGGHGSGWAAAGAGRARRTQGWRARGFAGAGVGFLCVRTQGPLGGTCSGESTMRTAPPCAERSPAGAPHPRLPQHLRPKGGWVGSTRATPRRPTVPRPALGAPDAQRWLRRATSPSPASPPWPHCSVLGGAGGLSVLTFFFSKPHCIG